MINDNITFYDQEDDGETEGVYYDLYNDTDLEETLPTKDILASIKKTQKTNSDQIMSADTFVGSLLASTWDVPAQEEEEMEEEEEEENDDEIKTEAQSENSALTEINLQTGVAANSSKL